MLLNRARFRTAVLLIPQRRQQKGTCCTTCAGGCGAVAAITWCRGEGGGLNIPPPAWREGFGT